MHQQPWQLFQHMGKFKVFSLGPLSTKSRLRKSRVINTNFNSSSSLVLLSCSQSPLKQLLRKSNVSLWDSTEVHGPQSILVSITYDEHLFRTEVLLVWKNLSENQMVASLKDEEESKPNEYISTSELELRGMHLAIFKIIIWLLKYWNWFSVIIF